MTARIVVGFDGSDHSARALDLAIEEARLRQATLEVVYAYVVPVYWTAPQYPVELPQVEDDIIREAEALVDKAAADVPSGVEVKRVIARGPAAHVLLEAAEGADLLIVGSRGRGGFRGLLLGSTSHQLVTHAPCPVVVVPHATG